MPKQSQRDMTRGVMESIKRAVETYAGCEPGDGLSRPIIQPGDFQESSADWVLTWEEGPYEWVFADTLTEIIRDVCRTSGQFYNVKFHTEPVYGWGCLALFVTYPPQI